MAEEDTVHRFFQYADRIVQDARFVLQSLPNAEIFAVERALRQLHAVNVVLHTLDDPWVSQAEIEGFVDIVLAIAVPLEQFLDHPPGSPVAAKTRLPGNPGRPPYDLDLGRALQLHNMGNSWEQVAHAMGVKRRTMYYHLQRAGLPSTRPSFTEIDDEDLDEQVSAISLKHPLAGSNIVRGHLEAIGIHVPIARVQESLKRVDAIGVLLR